MDKTRFKQESYTVDYAGLWIRLAALIIDIITLGLINWIINGIWGVASGVGWMGGSIDDPFAVTTGADWILNSLIIFLLVVGYFICFWGWRGQTPGKMALRVKVVRFDGSRIGWGGAAMRFLGYIISVILLLMGLIWVAVDARRQGLHDKIADTFVINLPRK